MPAGPWARKHADEPPESEKGQSADSGAFLLSHTVKFTIGTTFSVVTFIGRFKIQR